MFALAAASCQEQESLVHFSLAVKAADTQLELGRPHACVPRRCLETHFEDLECRAVAQAALEELREGLSVTSEPGWMQGAGSDLPMTGPSPWASAVYLALRARPPLEQALSGALKAAVVGSHGPLSGLVGMYLERAAPMELSLYGQCYLCTGFCARHHVASAADEACAWFHQGLNEEEPLLQAVQAIIFQPITTLVCVGLLMCHFLIEALPTIAQLQVLCMNPLQGVPEVMAVPLLEALDERLQRGSAVVATNAVTAALTAYHLSLPEASGPPVISFLNVPLQQMSHRLPREGRALLFAMQLPMTHSTEIGLLENLLSELWTYGVRQMPLQYDLEDARQVAYFLDHSAVVYVPEHPAKLVFLDFYSMALPIFLPSLGILSWLWPRLRVDDTTYDGWFDRRIVASRLRSAAASRLEPFNLDVLGEQKAHYWLQFADYYHFPGVQVFTGLASLMEGLESSRLEGVRVEMQKHFKVQSSLTASVFRALTRATGSAEPARRTRGGQAIYDVPFTVCLANHGWSVPARQRLKAWKIRYGAGIQPPRWLRLQVWRPIHVGWQKGRFSSFKLVSDHRARRPRRHKGTWRAPVPKALRPILRPGDAFGFAFQPQHRWWRRAWRRSFAPAPFRGIKAVPLCLGLARQSGSCDMERRICHFQEQDWLPSEAVNLEAELEDEEQKPSAGWQAISVAFEMPLRMPWIPMLLEWIGALPEPALRHDPSVLTLFVCALEADALLLETWRRVCGLFDVALGASTRCAEEQGASPEEAIQAARRFLLAVQPHGIWIVLSSVESYDLARALLEENPHGLGLALRARDMSIFETRDLEDADVPFFDFGFTQRKAVLPADLLQSKMHRPWGRLVLRFVGKAFHDAQEPPHEALKTHIAQLLTILQLARGRNLFEVLRRRYLWHALDISQQLDENTSYEEFMSLRRELASLELSLFEDKIQLRRWLQSIGVKHTPCFYMSNDDPNVLPHLERESFVLKPSHMTESEQVVVVREGRYVFDVLSEGQLQGLSGQPVDKEQLQRRVLDAWNRSAFSWECQAVLAARPGVIVEQLVTSALDPTSDKRRVEEARAHVVWGRLIALEWAVNRIGSSSMHFKIDGSGRWVLESASIWATHLGDATYENPDAWAEFLEYRCIPKVLATSERVALAARVDHLRVDLLIEDRCDQVYVSEVELFPAVPFPHSTMQLLERRWRRGYGF